MNFAIICSTKDPAAIVIKEALIKQGFNETNQSYDNHKIYQKDNSKIYTSETDSIYCENIDKKINADFFIFATRHASISGIQSLSCHTQGNWGKADFGGKEKTLALAPANYLAEAYLILKKLANNNFHVIIEVTHHGPDINKPSMFIEIGSDKTQWENKEAAIIIAKTINHLTENKLKERKIAFGIGGLHHAPIFTKLIERKNYAFGHICPKYNLNILTEDLINQAKNKTLEKPVEIIVDWKGLGKEKERIINILKNHKYQQAEKLLK